MICVVNCLEEAELTVLMGTATRDSNRAFTRIWNCKSRELKLREDLREVAKSSGHMKPGYQNFSANLETPSTPVPRTNND